MAEVKIVIKDLENGKVSVEFTPSAASICHLNKEEKGTAAHGYANACLNVIQWVDAQFKQQNKILLPHLQDVSN